MSRFLAYLGRHAPIFLALGVAGGVAMPPAWADEFVGALPVIVVFLVAAALVRIDIADVISHVRRPGRLAALLLFLMAIVPIGVHWLCLVLGAPADLHLALLLMAAAPPIASASNLAFIIGLDAALTLNVMVAGTLVMPLLAPAVLAATAGLSVDLDPLSLSLRLLLSIGAAMALAAVARAVIGRDWIENNPKALDGTSVLLMVVFVMGLMSDVGRVAAIDPVRVIVVLAIAMAANFGLQAVTALALEPFRKPGAGFDRSQSLAVGLVGGNRNMALFLVALPPEVGAMILLYLGVYQIPMYITPLVAGPVYRRLRAVP